MIDKIIADMILSQKRFEESQRKKGIPEALYKYEDIVEFKFCDNVKRGLVYVIDRYGTFEQHEEPSYDIMVKEENMLYKHIRQSKIIKKVEEVEVDHCDN